MGWRNSENGDFDWGTGTNQEQYIPAINIKGMSFSKDGFEGVVRGTPLYGSNGRLACLSGTKNGRRDRLELSFFSDEELFQIMADYNIKE